MGAPPAIRVPSGDWANKVNALLSRLSSENRYLCAAGIPGPMLELRSGALPADLARGAGVRSFVPLLAELAGLDASTLRRVTRAIAHEYRLARVLRIINSIADDAPSRWRLLLDLLAGVRRRQRGLASDSNPAAGTRHVRLRVRKRRLLVEYPANLVSIGLIWEIFGEETYRIQGSVKTVYDFGANTGLATLYFHALFPSAQIVCVEPHDANLEILGRNVARNSVPARVIAAAAGRTTGVAPLSYSDQSHALPSLYVSQRHTRSVPTRAFDEIVEEGSYGLKIDIEGAESELAAFPGLIRNAAWIVGELHYSGEVSHDAGVDTFFRIVEDAFDVIKSRPIIYFVGNSVMLCQGFRACRRTAAGAAGGTLL